MRVYVAIFPVQVFCVRRLLEYSVGSYRWLGGNRKAVSLEAKMLACCAAGCNAITTEQHKARVWTWIWYKKLSAIMVDEELPKCCCTWRRGERVALATQTGPSSKVHHDSQGVRFQA